MTIQIQQSKNKITCYIDTLIDKNIIKKVQMVFIKPVYLYYKGEKIELACPKHFKNIMDLLKIKKF